MCARVYACVYVDASVLRVSLAVRPPLSVPTCVVCHGMISDVIGRGAASWADVRRNGVMRAAVESRRVRAR